MFIIEVIPISRGFLKETLSYFSKESIALGSIIEIPLRNKKIFGVVTGSEDALGLKSEIKNLKFSLKKIDGYKSKGGIPKYLMNSIITAKDFFATTTGSMLGSILDKEIIEIFQKNILGQTENDLTRKEKKYEQLAIQSDSENRYDIYKTLIRESFAKNESVSIICPTIKKACNLKNKISKGIEKYTYFANSEEELKEIEKVFSSNHPLLIIGSPKALLRTQEKTSLIIIDEEHSAFYKDTKRPFVDWKYFANILAKEINAKIIFGDEILSIDTRYKIDKGEIAPYIRLSNKIHKPIKTDLVSMEKDENQKVWKAISKDLEEMILYTLDKKKKLLILSHRRGLASQTVCFDCGQTVLCRKCEAPVVLHSGVNSRIYICHHCGEKRDAKEKCQKCESWNLKEYGIGTETIKNEIEKLTNYKPIIIDKDNTKTLSAIQKKVDLFLEKGGILIATEMIFDYLEKDSTDYGAIASFDSLLSLPDIKTEEKIMHIINKIKNISKECLLIQSKNPEYEIIEIGLSGDINRFQKQQIESREQLNLYPFSQMIKITLSGSKEEIGEKRQKILNDLKDYNPSSFPAFIKSVKGKYIYHILIKVEKDSYPEKILLSKLLSLPPEVSVNVNPTSLL